MGAEPARPFTKNVKLHVVRSIGLLENTNKFLKTCVYITNPVFIKLAANSANTTLGTTDFNLEFRERTDFEPAGPTCRHESESMGFQNGLKVFAMITHVAAVCNQ